MASAGAGPRRDPADIADRIRHLGELHEAGLVTDEEFSVATAPDARRRGYSRACMESLIDWFREKGAARST